MEIVIKTSHFENGCTREDMYVDGKHVMDTWDKVSIEEIIKLVAHVHLEGVKDNPLDIIYKDV